MTHLVERRGLLGLRLIVAGHRDGPGDQNAAEQRQHEHGDRELEDGDPVVADQRGAQAGDHCVVVSETRLLVHST